MPIIINNQEIDDEIVEQEFATIKAGYESVPGAGCVCDRDDEFRDYARDNVIARVLIAQEAQRQDLPISDDEVESAWNELVEEHGGVESACFALGTTEDHIDEIKTHLKQQLQMNAYVNELTADVAPVTEQELQAWHKEHAEEYMTETQVRVLHLMKNTPRVEERETIYEQMRELRQKLLEGADFHQLAVEHSDAYKDPNELQDTENPVDDSPNPTGEEAKSDGIDLGYFARGEIMEEFEVVAFSMQKDEISPIFMTHYGFHMIKLLDYIPAEQVSFDEVKEQLVEDVMNEKKQEQIRKAVEEIKKTANIEIIEPKPWYEELDEDHDETPNALEGLGDDVEIEFDEEDNN